MIGTSSIVCVGVASSLASNLSIIAWPRCSRNPRPSIAAYAKHRVSVIDLSPVRLIFVSAAVVRLVSRRCRNRRHTYVRSSVGATNRSFFRGRAGRSAPSCKLLEMAGGELETCVICDTLVRRLLLARGPPALLCVLLLQDVR